MGKRGRGANGNAFSALENEKLEMENGKLFSWFIHDKKGNRHGPFPSFLFNMLHRLRRRRIAARDWRQDGLERFRCRLLQLRPAFIVAVGNRLRVIEC